MIKIFVKVAYELIRAEQLFATSQHKVTID